MPIQTVFLQPPLIKKETLLKPLVCTRPMREGCLNLTCTHHSQKKVLHCYGHGGAGWTTLFGSIKKILSHLDSKDKKQPIRVIGSGCMGLLCALELQDAGYTVSGIFTRQRYDLPSWKAAGYFGLLCMKGESDNIDLQTFAAYRAIFEGKHPFLPKESVRFMPVYCSQETISGIEELERLGMIPPKEPVTLDFGKGVIHKGFVKYMTFFINTTHIMQKLSLEVKKRGISIETRDVKTFDEVPESIICNCSGFGARELCHDSAMVGIRGHLMILNEKAGQAHMDYMIYTKVIQDAKEETLYLFPKSLCVSEAHPQGEPCFGALGGSFIRESDKKSDSEEIQRLLDRNSLFFQGHSF